MGELYDAGRGGRIATMRHSRRRHGQVSAGSTAARTVSPCSRPCPFPSTAALRRHGIVIEENRRAQPRQRRIEFDRALLEELYVNQDLSAEAVGQELGVTGALVLKRLHDHGIPVRRSRWDHPSDGPVRLEELKKNRKVRVALVKAGIPAWRETGAVAAESLGPELLRTLYEQLGLSTFDIELVTGRTQRGV